MRNGFEKWMKKIKKYAPGTVVNYAFAVDQISRHYSNEIGRDIDIYQINDLVLLKRIYAEYRTGGSFEDFGDENHGLCGAAIAAYVRYFEETGGGNISVTLDKETIFTVSDSTIAVKKDSAGRITVNISLQIEEAKE
jgi:hypothetical protein